jgi:ABC-2 type transport system permease protein
MVFHIAKKELTDTWRDKRFRWVSLLLIVLLVVSGMVSCNYYQSIQAEHEEARVAARGQWEGQAAKNPHSAAHFGTHAFKPVQPLSMIDNGLDKYLGISVFLEAHRQNQAQHILIADQNALARFGELTPAFVLIYLLPLLIILVAYGSVSGERESGTLRLVLSQGISKAQLALGKIAGIWLLVLLLVIPIFLFGLFFILSTASYQTEDLWRYGLMVLAFLLYFGVFVHVAVLVSTLAKSSNLSLLVLLFFWLVSAFMVPKFTANLSQYLHPTPDAITYQEELKEDLENGIDGHNPFNEVAKIFQDSVLLAHGVDSVQKLPFNYSGLVMQAGEEHERKVYDKHLNDLNDIYVAQLKTHEASAFLSPTVLTKMLSMQFAKTDLKAHFHFARQAEDYRINLVRDLNYDIKDNGSYGDWSYKVEQDFFKNTVRFDYTPITFSETWRAASGGMVFLSVWFLISFVFSLLAASRTKV